MTFDAQRTRYLQWIQNDVLPRSAEHGRDPLGGFYESLRPDGTPVEDAPKRLRVQARQAYAFARAESLGLISSGRAMSDEAFRFMNGAGFEAGDDQTPAGWVHTLNADGTVRDGKRDTYDHAFVLLAAAERSRVYGDEVNRETVETVWRCLDALRHPSGGLYEGAPHEAPRRQNPHMHWLEASLLQEKSTGDSRAAAAISEVRDLFSAHFWDAEHGVLREFFTEDWAVDPGKGAIIEPGHIVEWVWLLYEAGVRDVALFAQMVSRARETGLYPESGLLASAADLRTGERSANCRLWPQTEHIRACLVMADLTRDDAWLGEAETYLAAFFDVFVQDVAPGCYHDEASGDGRVTSKLTPSSTVYHLMTLADALLTLAR
ncbi:MAG: AGE family epimerase/isomerase [Pseudomonadota bacterium]